MTDDVEKHLGPHHFANCGEYRPRPGNFECRRCSKTCLCQQRTPTDQPRPSSWGGGARTTTEAS